MLKIKNLCFSYKNVPLFKNLNFEIKKNQILGFLGANGSGKTTIIECLEGIKEIQNGYLYFEDTIIDKKFKKYFGIQFQDASFFRKLKVKEIFKTASDIMNYKDDYNELMNSFDLLEHKNKYYEKLSGGMKQKTAIAMALMNKDAKIIFLDEPTVGLDVFSRKKLWRIIKNLKKENKTVIMTTHYIEEAEKLCDNIIILDKGKIIEHKTPDQLKEQYCKNYTISILLSKKLEIDKIIKKISFINNINIISDDKYHYEININNSDNNKDNIINNIITYLIYNKHNIKSLNIKNYNLETAFLNILGYKLDKNGEVVI